MSQKVDVGVVRNPAANIQATPVITDIGVPTNNALVTTANMPQGPAHQRADTYTAAGQPKGVGVPVHPATGVQSS